MRRKTLKQLVLGASCSAMLFASPILAADNLNDQAAQHIAAGEFGAAKDLAAQADDATKQQILKQVIFAQMQAGEPNAAQAIVPQMGQGQAGQNVRADLARGRMLDGGTGADFDSLMELIQQQTDGPWFEIDGLGGTIDSFESGVRVDPNGVLTREETTGRLAKIGNSARKASLNADMAQASDLRLVSLTRLEAEVARRLDAGQPVVESMKQLAGLSKIQYIFIYPEDGEIVLGGPAEGWEYDADGVAVGTESGRPTLQLDDLVTVLRTFSPEGSNIFGCSIDPKAENIQAVKEYAAASQARGALTPAGIRNWSRRIDQLLGLQDVTVYGVPANSRVARVLVDADYRMKLIGVGQIEGGSNVPDYFELLQKQPSLASGGLDAMRWWMTMNYDEVLHSTDQNSFEINGSAVKCQSENQFLTANGQRVSSGKAEPVNQQFAQNFTEHYQELVKQEPIFGDLQGVFDLAMTAALIERDQLDDRVNWNRGVFATNGAYQPEAYPVPEQADTVVNYKVFNGKDVVLQAAGGVRADLMSVVTNKELRKESTELATVSTTAKPVELPEGRWWWDAK